VATGGADATVNVWNTTDGSLFASLKAGGSNAIISCDLGIGLVACGGSDRSCRIYNIKTKRLVHQLVGHL
jgi:WD40 repeat protein